ncbi:MAG: DNA polymerase III subunit alpha [Candidatus Berkelbacteria bacterium Athens1014_28]|uniref:DNA polymerase III subunit alpha n=1 Tax=Candidatus Berkelbacteria bacterium Athens1014_28 TaxID=2017145 RepID=A0A554LNK3_9BACT|nr:MAG: DNA polymerase III subunit alpha [Candidatus Berkelbacteria bacterium Athens1014_28]
MPDDKPKSNFVHLHVHSHYSMLDGMGNIPDLVKKAKDDGQIALALTDHGVMHGAIEFYETCKKEGIKPLVGIETYIAQRTMKDKQPRVDANSYHLVLLAKNYLGYQNLMKITSIAHLEGYYYKPRIDKRRLKKYSEGIIALSACVQGEIPRKALEGIEKGRKAVREYLEIFPKDDFYLEVQHHPNTVPEQKKANENIFKLAKEFGLKVVATNDTHYVNSDDNIAHDALLCLQTGKLVSDENRLKIVDDDYSLIPTTQMEKNFADHLEVITNTLEVAEKCNLEIELGKFKFPEFPLPVGETYETYLRKLIDERLPKVVDKITPEMKERIDYEFKVIKDKKYLGYFLIVQDFFHFAKVKKIPTNTRGSAAGCFISYALGITGKQLNPLDYNLPFERFLNPYRPSAPDIDADIADSGRDEIIKYVSEKYGKDHVAQIITYGTMAARMAVRDVGRVLGMTYSEVDVIAKMIPPLKTTLKQALETVYELKNLYDSDINVKKCIDIARRLEGVVRHASVHAAGVVIAPGEITDYSPVMMDTKGGRLITQYEMHTVGEDGIGLIKMDFLGLANLSIIQNVIKIVKKTREIEVILDEIPLDDKKTFELLSRGETIGVFQLESEGMRKNIKELRPTTIHDIMAMVALYRPGPMAFIPEYIKRKHNPSLIRYVDPRMEKFLDKSLGLIVYQDDVLSIALELAGYNWEEVDKFRKAIGKKIKKEMTAQKEKFFKQIIERGMAESAAQELWEQIETFAGYGFNKAHAASYGLVAYQTAYLKANFPPEYMSALMTSNKNDLDKIALEIEECKRMGIGVLPPDINESFVDFGVVKNTGNVRFGLSAIKNVGVGVSEEIVEERKRSGNFISLLDFITRLDGKVINKKTMESLAMAGALDEFAERNRLLANMERILAYASAGQKNRDAGKISLFGEAEEKKQTLELEDTALADKKQRLSWERELLGMYISEHPLSEILPILTPHQQKKIVEIVAENENEYVRIAGVITNIQEIITRRTNQKMAFIKIEDQTKNIETLIFPKIYAEYSAIIQPDNAIVAEGFVSNKDGELKLLVEGIWSASDKNIPPFSKRAKRKNGGWESTKSEYRNPKQNGENPNIEIRNKEVKKTETITITLPKNADKKILSEIKEILTTHPGENPVIIRLPKNGEDYKEMKIKNRLNISPVVKRKIIEVVGKENVKVND